MTNYELIKTLSQNLDSDHNLSSNKLRCVNGRNLFLKCPDIGWNLAAIWDDEVAITCNYAHDVKLGRGKDSPTIGGFFSQLTEKRIGIQILSGRAPSPLRSRVRRISVKDVARELLTYHILQCSNRDKYDVMDAWNIVWSQAITQYAADFVEYQNQIAAKLSSSVFSNNLDHSSMLEEIRESVSKSDFSNKTTDKLSNLSSSLYDAYIKLSGVASEVRSKKDSQRYLRVKSCVTTYDSEHVSLSRGNSFKIAAPKDTNMFEQSATICQTFDRLDLPIPEVFGFKFCPENIPQLAVLNETMNEEVDYQLKRMSGLVDDIDTNTTTDINTTTHLLA